MVTIPTDRCESCGRPADYRLRDGSTWCSGCHWSALNLGYDTDTDERIAALDGAGADTRHNHE